MHAHSAASAESRARGLAECGHHREAGALQREQELWDAVKAGVNAERPDMLSDFSSMIDLSATAVRFDRAADADKAAKNLKVLTEVFLDS